MGVEFWVNVLSDVGELFISVWGFLVMRKGIDLEKKKRFYLIENVLE